MLIPQCNDVVSTVNSDEDSDSGNDIEISVRIIDPIN